MADQDRLPRWWTKDTVAVVTGGNTGIGFATARRLAKYGVSVVLTARDYAKGAAATEVLKGEGLEASLHFHSLDVTSSESIAHLATWLKAQFGGVDILVNNAEVNSFSSTYDDGVTMFETNYYGVKKVTSGLRHLLRDESPAGARIVNVSSTTGQLEPLPSPTLSFNIFFLHNAISPKHLQSAKLRETLADEEHLSEEVVDSLATTYLEDLKQPGKLNGEEWPWATSLHSYRESKAFMNAYSRVLAKSLEEERSGTELSIFVNCACPGLTNTDLRRGRMKWIQGQGVDVSKGKSPDEGADTIVWLALLPKEGYPHSKIFGDRKEISF